MRLGLLYIKMTLITTNRAYLKDWGSFIVLLFWQGVLMLPSTTWGSM